MKDKEKWGLRNLCRARKCNKHLIQTLNIINTGTYKYVINVEVEPNNEIVYIIEKLGAATGKEIYTNKGFVYHNPTRVQYNITGLPKSVRNYIAEHLTVYMRVLNEGESVLDTI